MHRLFVAIVPPPLVRDRLLAAMGGVAGARWQTDEQLHLTLRFIGEVDRHRADDVAAALGTVHAPRFELALGQPGTFDRKGRIGTLWVGVRPHDPVAALARRIDQALQRVGVPPETRAFVPHITVARFGREAGSVAAYLAETPSSAWFEVDAFALFESTLGRTGPDYRIIERYPLE